MKTYRLNDGQVNISAVPRSVALGLFDGLHPGHRQVILAATQTADDSLSHAVYTFIPHTLSTKAIAGRLCDDAEEQVLLENIGVDELFKADFTAVRHLSPEEFVQQVLVEQLHARHVTCGFNYRFGAGGRGDAALLTQLCADHGITVTVVPEVDCADTPINSTAIRAAIADGDMALTRRLLGRPYRLQIPVTRGQGLGHKLGMPTINQVLPQDLCAPKFGVYASSVQIGTRVYPAVTNIGVRPTVGADAPLAETYILNYDGDLYDTVPTVYPLEYLREERAFDSLEALQAQIARDVENTAARFAATEDTAVRAVFFDFDDTLDDRDAAFLHGLTVFLTYYYPTLSPEELSRRREEMFRYQRGEYGNAIDYPQMIRHFLALWPSDKAADPQKALFRFFHGFAAGGKLHPDVLPTLTALRQRGYLIGIITNGHRIPQTCKMDHSGLRPYADLMMLAGEEGVQKPDPAIFHMAAARLGVPPAACLYVGDHPVNDIGGALKADFKVVLKLSERAEDHPIRQMAMPTDVPTIASISDLLGLLDDSTT